MIDEFLACGHQGNRFRIWKKKECVIPTGIFELCEKM